MCLCQRRVRHQVSVSRRVMTPGVCSHEGSDTRCLSHEGSDTRCLSHEGVRHQVSGLTARGQTTRCLLQRKGFKDPPQGWVLGATHGKGGFKDHPHGDDPGPYTESGVHSKQPTRDGVQGPSNGKRGVQRHQHPRGCDPRVPTQPRNSGVPRKPTHNGLYHQETAPPRAKRGRSRKPQPQRVIHPGLSSKRHKKRCSKNTNTQRRCSHGNLHKANKGGTTRRTPPQGDAHPRGVLHTAQRGASHTGTRSPKGERHTGRHYPAKRGGFSEQHDDPTNEVMPQQGAEPRWKKGGGLNTDKRDKPQRGSREHAQVQTEDDRMTKETSNPKTSEIQSTRKWYPTNRVDRGKT